MDHTVARAENYGPPEMFASKLEDTVVSAVEQIWSALADTDKIFSDPEAASSLLVQYRQAIQEIVDAAAIENEGGLRDLCQPMAAHLDAVIRSQGDLNLATHTLLVQWPDLVLNYMANPDDPASAEALLLHLQDPAWPSFPPADTTKAPDLLLHCRTASVPASPPTGDDGTQAGHAQEDNGIIPTTESIAPQATDRPESDLIMDDPRPEESDATETDCPTEAIMDEVSVIFAFAEQDDLLGLQEACLRVMQNAGLFAEAAIQPGAPAYVMLEQFPQLAHGYIASPHDPDAARLLTDYLSAAEWPEPLTADEAESLQLILLAGNEDDEDSAVAGQTPDGESAAVEPQATGLPLPETKLASEPLVVEQQQVVNEELIEMLASELGSMRQDLEQILPATATSNEGAGEAVEAYADLIERLGTAAEAIGLPALGSFLGLLHDRLAACGANGFTAGQRGALELLPDSVLAYLAAPGDTAAGDALLDLLREDAWLQPPEATHLASLLRALAMVEVTRGAMDAELRQTEALPEDVSLALPDDLSQELLDGLLQEMPIQTGDFSAAIQRIATGQGTLQDIDAAKRAAHTLKGAANTVGIKGIANLTHHVEDILVALSKHQTLPGRKLAAMLTNAGDCLEAMGEAVMGTGPEPAYALSVLQDILNWANRIDREGIPDDDAPAESPKDSEPAAGDAPGTAAEATTSLPAQQATEALIRVPAGLVDELLRLVGETIISTGQVRERLQRLLRQNKAIRAQNSVFLQLATELEELVDVRGAAAGFDEARQDEEFDPLEFEHFGELHTVSRRLIEAATDAGELSSEVDGELGNLGELVDVQNRLHEHTQTAVMRTRMVPVSTIVSRLQRSVRQAGRLLDKPVALDVIGADTMIDSNILNELVDPMMHMLRNAVDHGIEAPGQRAAAGKNPEGRIELRFAREGNQVVVRCRDDGAGLDLSAVRRTAEGKGLVTSEQVLSNDELARLILAPGFSTRIESTQVSGRGVGMDVVYSRVLQLKGGLSLKFDPGKGLEIELRLPAMLIATHALLVRSRSRIFAISSYGIQDIRYVTPDQVQKVGTESFIRKGEELMPLADLDVLLNLQGERRGDERKGGFPALLVRDDTGAVHVMRVQEIIDSRSLVVKGLGRYVPKPHGVVGATILGDGSVVAVIDIPELMRKPTSLAHAGEPDEAQLEHSDPAPAAQSRLTAMVVDDSLSARRATAQFMKDAGFEVRSAIDGLEAVSIIDKWKPRILLVDMEMPRMNGLELTAHVRAHPDTAKIPVIMITSRSTEKHRHQAQAAGVNVYLTKPFGDDELLRHVTELTAA